MTLKQTYKEYDKLVKHGLKHTPESEAMYKLFAEIKRNLLRESVSTHIIVNRAAIVRAAYDKQLEGNL